MARTAEAKIKVTASDRTKGVLGRVQKQVLAIGAAYLGWRAVTGLISGIVKAGIEYEKVWNDVGAALERHGFAVDENLPKVQAFSDQMQRLSGVSDEVIGKSIQGFIDYGNTMEEAMNTTKVALDLAAGGGMDLRAATDLLTKASVGYTGTLSRYGIIIDENIPKTEKFAAAVAQINERFGGAAQARMKTMAGKVDLLGQTWGDFLEELYRTGEAAEIAQGAISFITVWLENLVTVINMSIKSFKAWYDFVLAVIREIGTAFTGLGELIWDVFSNKSFVEISATFTKMTSDLIRGFAEIQREFSQAIGQTAITVAVATLAHANAVTAGIESARNAHETASKEIIQTKQTETDILKQFANDWLKENQVVLQKVAAGHLTTAQKAVLVWDEKYGQISVTAELFADSLHQTMQNAVSNIVGSLEFLQTESTGIFKQMAADFSNYFISGVLSSVAGTLVGAIGGGGILGILGSLFDTPANDRMAMTQGKHFAHYFTEGVTQGLQPLTIGPSISNAIAPAMSPLAMAAPGGGDIHIHVEGNIIAEDDWVDNSLVPKIEQAVVGGKSRLIIEDDNLTGRGVMGI